MTHTCKRDELVWDEVPECGIEGISYRGRCPTCGKEWQQVFAEIQDGLWDMENQCYVSI